ncbi:MAG: cysteine desulfurase [Oscillospiraceae bacterium]|nr:cysteine desulfurase [Oscillospiraceae bacterium]
MNAYLDNSATTRPCEQALTKAVHIASVCYGNPSSFHFLGFEAKKELETARKSVADFIGAKPDEIYFTSGGTASNMTAILGTAAAKKREGKKIITSRIEHPSVIKNFELLGEQGFTTVFLEPDRNGKINLDSIYNAVDANTILVSLMAVNNEVGSIQDFDKVKQVIKAKRSTALYHCDAVQAFGKIKMNPAKSGIDLMSMSAHKIHGLKGSGALYVNQNVRIKPAIVGGGQESGLVSGTEAMPALCAFGEAVKSIGSVKENFNKVKSLRDGLLEKLSDLDYVYINSPEDALPYILNISVKGVPSQVMLNSLSSEGICVSAGSACSKGHRSGVLSAMNIEPTRIDSAIRVSLSKYTGENELNMLFDALVKTACRIRR